MEEVATELVETVCCAAVWVAADDINAARATPVDQVLDNNILPDILLRILKKRGIKKDLVRISTDSKIVLKAWWV